MTIKPAPGPNRILRSFFQLETEPRGWRRKRKKERKKRKGEEGSEKGCFIAVPPSIILLSILVSFESTRATSIPSPRPPSISLFHIYAPDGIPPGKFSSVVRNGLHYHNLSDGTTLPRGLGGFNVIINQNPRWWRCGEYAPPLHLHQSLSPSLFLSADIMRFRLRISRDIFHCVYLFFLWKRELVEKCRFVSIF